MRPQLQPLSVRLSPDDLAFLAGLQREGCVSAGDKVRALIGEARKAADIAVDPDRMLDWASNALADARAGLRAAERAAGMHSLLVAQIYDALTSVLAQARPGAGTGAGAAELKAFEAGLVGATLDLVDIILRQAVTTSAAAYDNSVVNRLLEAHRETLLLVATRLNSSTENKGQ